MNRPSIVEASQELKAIDIHEVLSNSRRQHAIEILRDAGGKLSARELSERIAEAETGESPPPSNIRQSVYVSLHQTHLPKLDDLGIVNYDSDSKTIELLDRAREVSIYLETVSKYGLSWSEYYLGVSLLGLLLIIASEMGVPVIGSLSTITLAIGTFVLIMVSAVYQTTRQRSSILHRIKSTQ